MPMINIEDSYILDETGAQVNKVTGLFTKDEGATNGEKAQARANIGAGSTNPSLLDNPWFTVNQRSLTSGAAFTYAADRWTTSYGSGDVNWTRNSDGTITVAPTNTASHGDLIQKMPEDLFAFIVGKTVTASVMLQDGTIYSGSTTPSTSTDRAPINITDIGTGTRLQVRITTARQFTIDAFYGSATIKAVKLELGSVSTLANDAPPDYGTELAKCQYRCVVYDLPGNFLLCRGIATNSTNIRGIIDLPTNMASDKTPTISLTGSLTTPQGNAITSITAPTYARNNKLPVNLAVSSVTSGATYDIFTGQSTPKIVISADL